MASLSIRKGKYYANYKVNDKSVQRCTGIEVKMPGVSPAAAKKLAAQAADLMERTAKGLTPAAMTTGISSPKRFHKEKVFITSNPA